MALPIFMVPVPRETEVSVARPSRKRFPDSLLRQGVTGTVILGFAVDTNGVADTTAIKDASPDIRDALPRKMRTYYNQFVATARGMIADTRYVTATINGCRVRQTVRQPFSWVISA